MSIRSKMCTQRRRPMHLNAIFSVSCVVAALLAVGCRNHLFNVALRNPVAVRIDRPIDVGLRNPIELGLNTPITMNGDLTTRIPTDYSVTPIVARPVSGDDASGPLVAMLDVDGMLLNRNMTGLGSMGENPVSLFREKLAAIQRDVNVDAVVLRINSPGGGVTASDIMRRELIDFKSRTGLPIVAVVMETGTGGAYYLATACDQIVAHPTSIVGGVGVILNLYNLEDAMAQFNIVSSAVRSGELVDAGSPVRFIEPEAESMLQAIADSFHERFVDTVKRSRPNFAATDQADSVFQGGIMIAETAMEAGLIDQIGYVDDGIAAAVQAAAAMQTPTINAGVNTPPRVNLYHRMNDRAQTVYDVTPNSPLQNGLVPLRIPGLDRASMPTFLYMWQVEPTLEAGGG